MMNIILSSSIKNSVHFSIAQWLICRENHWDFYFQQSNRLKLKAAEDELQTLLLLIKNGVCLQLNQPQLLKAQDKLKSELQLLKRNSKIEAEQQELLLQLQQLNGDELGKASMSRKQAAKVKEKQAFQLAEKRSIEADQQRALV